MKILLLGNKSAMLEKPLRDAGHVTETETGIISEDIAGSYDFLVSFGYRHILNSDVLYRFSEKAVNLHISFLPYNKGADPNIWSFLEDTKKGVTIHELAPSLDAGNIILRQEIVFEENETLKTSYDKLTERIIRLFTENMESILSLKINKKPQEPGGTYHKLKDKDAYAYLWAEKGYDTPVDELKGKALI